MWDFNHQLHKSWQPGVVTEFINHSDWTEDHSKNEALHADGKYSTSLLLGLLGCRGLVWTTACLQIIVTATHPGSPHKHPLSRKKDFASFFPPHSSL